jgi:hypothetical protein
VPAIREDALVRERAIHECAQVVFQLGTIEQAGMMLEERADLPVPYVKCQGVEIAHVRDKGIGMRPHDAVIESAK